MRTAFLLLSTVSLLAACGDDADTTAPRSPSAKTPVAPAASTPALGVNSGAPPKGATGFTTVTNLTSPVTTIDGIAMISGVAWVTCPAGSVIVGGGYEFTWGTMNARIGYNGPVGTNMWKVVVHDAGVSQISFKAFGTCIG